MHLYSLRIISLLSEAGTVLSAFLKYIACISTIKEETRIKKLNDEKKQNCYSTRDILMSALKFRIKNFLAIDVFSL